MKKLLYFILAGSAALLQAAEPILLKAADFARSHVYTWPDNRYGNAAEHIRKSGSLGSLKGEGTRGFLEYDFNIPADGWYEIASLPANIPFLRIETTLDGRFYYPLQKEARAQRKPANSLGYFHLAKGKHTIRLEIRALQQPFPKITGIQLKEAAPENRIRIESTAPFVNEITARKGSKIPFRAEYSDRAADSVLIVKTVDKKTKKSVGETKITLPASQKFRSLNFSIPVEHDGVFEFRYELDGRELSEKSAMPYVLAAIDTTPVKTSATEPEAELLREIDCVREEPDYAKGKNKVVTNKTGSFRESSRNSGWDKGSPEEWFAWKFTVPEPEALYKFEIDYPDDTARASHFAIRQVPSIYARVLGVNSGREFRPSGKMQTAVIYAWIYGREGRVLVMPGGNHMPAAVSRIRISKLKNKLFQPLDQAKDGMRRLQYFYEEASSVIGMETGSRFDARGGGYQPELVRRAVERYCSQTAYMGATEHLYAVEIYGGGLWPSKYQPCRWTRPYSADNVAKLLLAAEKYGQNCIFDFHPVPMDFHPAEGELHKTENRMMSSSGNARAWNDLWFFINPIHPDTAKWRNGMLADFVRRYKDYKNFKGIRIRNMRWQNSGWSNFQNINWGYDDYTVGQFEKETGIKVPGEKTDRNKYGKRAAFLLGGKRKEWMEWRARKVTEIYLQARDTIRKIRPDLELYANLDDSPEKDYEAGIDAEMLKKHGISVSWRTYTGRNPSLKVSSEQRRITSLRQFEMPVDPRESESAMHHWLIYYEGPGIAKNEEIGLPGKPANWWGYAAWPAGRNELEFWALGLARRDVSLFLTGTIGYGFGTPLMREFLNEFNRLPAKRFESLAKDPVAIRSYKKYFYAVNSLPVPVNVSIELDDRGFRKGRAYRVSDGSEFNVKSFELKPYQLTAFTTDTKIESFSVTVPESYETEMQTLAAPVFSAAKENEDLKEFSGKLAAALKKKEYCSARLLLETNEPFLRENGVSLPNLYRQGAPKIPKTALFTPVDKAEAIPAKTLFPDWNDEIFRKGKVLRYEIDMPVSGECRPVIAHVGGKEFGDIQVYLDGVPAAGISNAGGVPYFSNVSTGKTFQLTAGKHVLELRSSNGKNICVYYVAPTLLMRPIPCRFFQIGKVHITGADWKTVKQELEKPLPGDTDRNLTGTAYWTHSAPHPDPKNHVVALGGGKDGNIRNVLTYIHSRKPQTVQLMVGADYFWRLSVNGKLIDPFGHQEGGGRAVADGKRYNIELKKGWNEILLKVASGIANHCLWLSVTDPGGIRFSDLGPYRQ